MAQTFPKDPQADLDYEFDWSDWLDDDTISTSTMTAETGITVESSSNTTTTATVWLSGGTARTSYRVTNHIVTAAGRADDRTITINVRDR